MLKITSGIVFLILQVVGVNLVFAQNNIDGFYTGIGTGLNITANSNLIKTYGTEQEIHGISDLGNVSAGSLPILIDAGYRFNPYLSAEFTYSYSGNQQYTGPVGVDGNKTTFWGSQNVFGVSALGYVPLTNNLYLKGRLGLAYAMATMTTYIGDPGTKMMTSEIGVGLQYFMSQYLSLDFDYINYGLLMPLQLNYKPPAGGAPNLGVIDTISNNQFFVSLTVHY